MARCMASMRTNEGLDMAWIAAATSTIVLRSASQRGSVNAAQTVLHVIFESE